MFESNTIQWCGMNKVWKLNFERCIGEDFGILTFKDANVHRGELFYWDLTDFSIMSLFYNHVEAVEG